ncbi:MAG: hypothetical protein ABII00_06460 [Elusimicrobiota bacterium]
MAIFLSWSPAFGSDVYVGRELPRKILALYNKAQIPGKFPDIAYTELHLFAEMPLNHLGMDLVYHDVNEPLPAVRLLEGYRGIITWFPGLGSVPEPAAYCRWLHEAMDAGLKVVVLGDTGAYGRGADKHTRMGPACSRAFRRLGVELEEVGEPESGFLRIVRKDSGMVEFERRLSFSEFPEFRIVHALEGATSYLRIGSSVDAMSHYEPVVTSPSGGIAVNPFVLYTNKQMERERAEEGKDKYETFEAALSPDEQFRWRINPFAFFEAAFGLHGWPRPDTTTINGRRIYYSHLDGDGFFNVSEYDHKSWSAAVYLKEVLERYPESPFSVSVVTGYYRMRRFGGPKAIKLSRKILGLPNVDPGSHGHTHPFIWHKEKLGIEVPGFEYSVEAEIRGSLDIINKELLPEGKRARLFQWTGDCMPGEEAIRLASEDGYLNMNGGDTRFDRRFNSVAFVTPLGRRIGDALQVYSSNSNENTYTNLWHGPYYGYREVIETFENTDSPRRLKPVNIYMHYYSSERIASIKALLSVYEWVHARPLFPIFAREYSRLVVDFFAMRIHRLGPGRYRFEGGSRVRTVRFDEEERYPDLERSKGVLGFRRYEGSLYVFFDEGRVRELALTEKPPSSPYLSEANFDVTGWRVDPDGVRFRKRGWWKGEMVLAGLPPERTYRIRAGRRRFKLRAGRDGRLSFRFPGSEGTGPPEAVLVEPVK